MYSIAIGRTSVQSMTIRCILHWLRFLPGMAIAAISLFVVNYAGCNDFTTIFFLVIGSGGGALSLAGHVTIFWT